MSFLNDEHIKGKGSLNMAPMIDFLFLMLMFFASLAVSRVVAKNTDIDLVKIEPENHSTALSENEYKLITINIASDGSYQWMTQTRDHPMKDAEAIAKELRTQHHRGKLPEDKSLTHVMLRIDKQAAWEPILKAIFAIRDSGFEVHPVYEPFNQEQQLTNR